MRRWLRGAGGSLRNTKQIHESFGPLGPSGMYASGGEGPAVWFVGTTVEQAVADDEVDALLEAGWRSGNVEAVGVRRPLEADSAVRIGNDTVAAIAGSLLGARWGASAVPWRWRRAVHGWPGRDARDLVSLATLTVLGGRAHANGWPEVEDAAYFEGAEVVAGPHPYDDGVLLGTHASAGHEVDAVVSMCRVGRRQACSVGATEVVESRLIDSDDPRQNPNLAFAMYDAADAVRGLRAEGKRVLLHCVAAHQRTPSVAVAYAVLLGHEPAAARRAVLAVLPGARGAGAVWDAAVAAVPDRSGRSVGGHT